MGRLTAPERIMYSDFISEFPRCWACEYQPLPKLDNVTFNNLENAHIVGGAGRRHDRRCLVRLCMVHHKLSHGEVFRYQGQPLDQLNLANFLWLKQQFDPDFYDVEYIQSLRVQSAQTLTPEPVFYFLFDGVASE